MLKSIMAFFKEEKGLTAVEYAIAGGVVVATVAALFTDLGTNVNTRIQALVTATS